MTGTCDVMRADGEGSGGLTGKHCSRTSTERPQARGRGESKHRHGEHSWRGLQIRQSCEATAASSQGGRGVDLTLGAVGSRPRDLQARSPGSVPSEAARPEPVRLTCSETRLSHTSCAASPSRFITFTALVPTRLALFTFFLLCVFSVFIH